jgi:LAGLIDADG DNA endonuclease family protein
LTERLAWPPNREDLERLYLVEKMSAAKIARAYGLKYKNPKVAESTVLYHLRRDGIRRRDAAEHIRKVTDPMVDEWVVRYQAGESLKQIAGDSVDAVTVWNHLRKRGVVLRDKVEAQIQAVTKYERRPFAGDSIEKAYLMGLRYGDLHVVRHGRAVRVRVSTTHPAMAELFESVFAQYGNVARYPRAAKLVGYEWTLECDLDRSFDFLLNKPSIHEMEVMDDVSFLAFLAGFFDAEGSIILHKKGSRYDPEISFVNTDRELLDFIFARLRQLGFTAYLYWRKQREERGGITGRSSVGRIVLFKFDQLQEFLRRVTFRHREKVAKADLVRRIGSAPGIPTGKQLLGQWTGLASSIRKEREDFIGEAARLALGRSEKKTGSVRTGLKQALPAENSSE